MDNELCRQCDTNEKYKNRSICLGCLAENRKAQRAADPERAQRERDYHREYRNTPERKALKAERHRRWMNQPGIKERKQETYYARKNELWSAVLEAYGNQCECCAEKIEKFLTIDHTNRDGYLSKGGARSGEKLWKSLRDLGFPKDNYRLLCYNCNCGRERNDGICPHQSASSGVEPE